MKKALSLVIALAMIFTLAACGQKEPEKGPGAYVTIVNSKGQFCTAAEFVEFFDYNEDGAITADELLKAAHKQLSKDAESAYASEDQGYGTSITKLWGEESTACGYYINNIALMNLDAEVKENDHLAAFVYQDQAAWSDAYAWFDPLFADGSEVKLTAYSSSMWTGDTAPVAGASVLIDGNPSEFKTDDNGIVTVTGLSKGDHILTFKSDTAIYTCCLCKVTVK